jgi:P pilus assembly chaperone PapD
MRFSLVLLGAAVAFAMPARADMVLNQVILDFAKPNERRGDIEVENRGKERMYVVVEPAEIANPGAPQERRVTNPDPEAIGLLATPARLVLEPGERKIVRIAVLKEPKAEGDRVYRVTIKPVSGRLQADKTAIKVLVGYDVLVMQRPATIRDDLKMERRGQDIVFRNNGNTNVLLFDGKQCDAAGRSCRDLEAKRIYAGQEWRMRLPRPGAFRYYVRVGGQTQVRTFN